MSTKKQPEPPSVESQPATIGAYQLGQMVGVTERRLRQLAAEGIIPAPARNRYPLASTLHAILDYYRRRDENRTMLDVYPSFDSCSKATHIPVELLKRAQRQGCPAVRGGKVQLAGFLAWYYGEGKEPHIDLEAEQARYVNLQNAKLKLMIGRLKGEYIPSDVVFQLGAELGRAIRRVVLSTHRLAPSIVGQPKEKIEALLKQQEEAVVAQLEIMDRTINSWSEMGEKIEKTLGPLGDPV